MMFESHPVRQTSTTTPLMNTRVLQAESNRFPQYCDNYIQEPHRT